MVMDLGSDVVAVGNHYTCAEQRLVTKPDNDPLPVALGGQQLIPDPLVVYTNN
jgi:hypothetical protein